MIKLKLQMFGGRGGSSGGGGTGYGLPKVLDDDKYRPYIITRTSGNKSEEEFVYATRWQIKEMELNYAEDKVGDYPKYMRQTRHTFSAILHDKDTGLYKTAKEVHDTKEGYKNYLDWKKRFAKRLKGI